jgi:phosphopantetheine adenylyltransferase
MKKFKQLMEGLPPKKIVFAFGRFQPPTIGHELLVKTVKKIAGTTADHIIYASKTQDAKKNPLAVERKVYYLKRMFPGMNFAAATEQQRTFMEVAAALNKKYKHIVMVAGSDRIADYKRLLNTYNGKDFNFDSIEVVSAGERDPDADDATGMSGTKMREAAKKGDFKLFKTGLPHTITDLDARRLMNELRKASGLQPVKESLNIVVDELREKYFKGEIFNVGDVVTCNEETFSIVKRGSNHLLVKAEDGSLHSKWIHEVQVAEDIQIGYTPTEVSFGGYTTKNFHHHDYVSKAFEMTIKRLGSTHPQEVLEALKSTDAYMAINDVHIFKNKKPTAEEMNDWISAHERARMILEGLNEFTHHQDYWHMHQHELQDQLSNFKEEGKSEMQDEYDFSKGVRGAVLKEEDDQPLTNKTLKPTDKIKVARVIAAMLGVENPETMTDPNQLVNAGLRKLKSKTLNPDSVSIVSRMLDLADDVGIDYDEKLLQSKLKEENAMLNILKFREYHKKDHLRKIKRNYQLGEEEIEEATPYYNKPSFVKRMSAMAKRERMERERKEKEQQQKPKNEEVENIDEISQKLAGNYYGAATKQHIKKVGIKPNMYDRIEKDMGKNRKAGVDRALDRVTGARKTNEELDIPVLENEEMWASRVIDEEEINNNALPLHADAQFPEGSEDFEEMTDEEIDAIVNSMTDEDILEHGYDDEELAVLDADTGEEIELDKEDEVKEAALMEVLSRLERMKARARFKRTETKRERRLQIALRKTSDTKTINTRARRMAIKTIKQRLAKKPLNKLSVAEKERLEQRIQRMKPVLNRIAMRMAPRVRRLERERIRK